MKKRILSIALVVAMIVVMIPAMLLPTAAFDYYNGYVTAKVNEGAITVDGSATPDAAYLNSEKIVSTLHYDNRNESGETSSFYGYTATDDKGLFLWVKITDQSLDKGNGYDKTITELDPDTMEETTTTTHYDIPVNGGDKVQLYIKLGGATSSAARASGSFEFDYLGQIRGYSPKYPKNYANINGETLDFNPALVEFKTTTNDSENYWVLETYIPWEALGGDFATYTSASQFTTFQIGLQANNMATTENGAAGNDHKAYCYDTRYGGGYYNGMTSDHAYHKSTTNSFRGTHCVPLSFAGFTTAVVTTAPVVDGKMDNAYLKSQKIDAYDAAGKGKNFVAYTAATAEGYYVYADIIDDTLDKAPGTTVDAGDKFQMYFQMGNRFSNRDWGYVEMDYRTEGEYTGEGNAIPFRFVTKGPWADNTEPLLTSGIKYATTKKADGSGWTAELFIPWAGRMVENNFGRDTGLTMAIALQVNNYTNDAKQLTYCLSDAWAGGAWYAYNGGSGDASGNYYCAPVIFDFDVDNAAENIIRWAKYTTESIALDGVMDEAYTELAGEAIDFTYVHSAGLTQYPELAEEMGWAASGWKDWSFAKAYYLFTDTDVYVFVDVNDTTVAKTCDTNTADVVSIFFENSDSVAKFAISPFEGGKFITNSTYTGTTVPLPASNSVYAENDMIALKLKGTADAYTGYTVEFKLPLTEKEKADLAAGQAVNIGMGFQANDYFEQAQEDGTTKTTRSWYSFNVPYGNLWWQNGADLLGTLATPKVLLDKTMSEEDFSIVPEITSAQVALGESITMNYFANLPVDAVGAAQMKFTFNGAETIVKAAATDVANEYVFAFDGIAPQCMGDNIKAELLVNGEVVATKDNYSVFQNTFDVWAKDSSNAKLTSLVGDLWAYGAAAQKFAGYKTDDLVNEGYEHFATKVNAIEGVNKVLDNASENFYFTAAGVYFDNTNKLYAKFALNPEIAEELIEMGSLKAKVNDVEVSFEPIKNDDENEVKYEYIVYTGEILVTEFADTFTFVITDGSDTATLEYSVNAYCQAKLGNAVRPEAATLAAATYAYGVSALAYAG